MMRVERFDFSGRLDKFERTPSGGLRIPAWIARTGVQLYRDADGRKVRELRPTAEVLSEAAVRSFEDAAVTVLHPDALVTPETWKRHAVGTVRNVRADGTQVAADLVITDADAIRRIESGELLECSAGYSAVVDPAGGEADGQRYDAVQRQIRGNHVALGPEGWGRAGPTVRLRLDAAHQVLTDEEDIVPTRLRALAAQLPEEQQADFLIGYAEGYAERKRTEESRVDSRTADPIADLAKRNDAFAAECAAGQGFTIRADAPGRPSKPGTVMGAGGTFPGAPPVHQAAEEAHQGNHERMLEHLSERDREIPTKLSEDDWQRGFARSVTR